MNMTLSASYAVLLAALMALPVMAQPAPDSVHKLETTVQRDLFDVAWKPVVGDSYALIVGASGAMLQYTGRFFINLSPNVTADLLGVGWNPSGTGALIVGDGGTVLEFDGNSLRALQSGRSVRFEDICYHPGGTYALIVGHNGTLLKFDGNAFTNIATGTNAPIVSVSWRPDGRFAFLCGDFPEVMRYDPQTGEVIRLATGTTQFSRKVAWRPDGNAAIVVGTVGTAFKFDGSNFVPLNSPSANEFLAASWSPDNRTATITARTGLMYRYEDGGAFQSIVTNTTASLRAVAYTLNGSYVLAVGDGGLAVRYPPSEAPPIEPPDGPVDQTFLYLSAAIIFGSGLAMLGVALYLSRRSRKRELDKRKLEEAQEHAQELALSVRSKARTRNAGNDGPDAMEEGSRGIRDELARKRKRRDGRRHYGAHK